jgi:hypothetical protein
MYTIAPDLTSFLDECRGDLWGNPSLKSLGACQSSGGADSGPGEWLRLGEAADDVLPPKALLAEGAPGRARGVGRRWGPQSTEHLSGFA